MEAPVAILAGGGSLPLALAEALRQRGRPVEILALRGFADRPTRRAAGAVRDLLDAQGVLDVLHGWRPGAVTMAGYVHRPGPLALLGAYSAFRNRDLISRLAAAGDDGLLRGVVNLLEDQGFTVAGVHALAPELLAPTGVLGETPPLAAASVDIGFAVLASLSPYDVGQAVAVAGTRVCAVEGPEGTDAMISRVRKLWGSGRLPRSDQAPVLVKTAKAGQDLRIDMPVIGPRTVRCAAAAGFAGIAVGAGKTMIIDQAATVAEANRRNVFLIGTSVDQNGMRLR
ncbi:LpxI family protein [Camelimonas sp. ID_303_24]